MKHTYIIALILMSGLLGGCTPWAASSPECKTYLKGLQEDWDYDAEQKVFKATFHDGRTGKDFLPNMLFDHKDCLVGRTEGQIRKLLGEPSKINGLKWSYYFLPSCNSESGAPCDYFLLKFDDAGKLVDIDFAGMDLID